MEIPYLYEYQPCARNAAAYKPWETKWNSKLQKQIEEHWLNKIPIDNFQEDSEKEKFYILSMFPYPSGNLHMGHVRVYTISDVIARYQRLKGKNVIHPIGWDAFGLPAENAALERNLDPESWTQKNIENMKSVMERLNLSFDWNREFATCDSDYYKWTQYFFLKMYENDLVYRKEAFVNWDPVDQTVLADEQVDENGLSWRSGAVVEKKLLKQWFIRTSRYWESLLEGLEDPILVDWTEVKKIQAEWIGRNKGAAFEFQLVDNQSELDQTTMTVWIEKPEYIHKVKYVAVDPESAWNSCSIVSGLLPYKLRNPMSGEVIPVYVTKLFNYASGTGTHAGMPEMYESDRMYAQSVNLHYTTSGDIIATKEELEEHRHNVCEEAKKMGVGGYAVSDTCRDWLISRQRYWGTPIPIVYCEKCGGPQAVSEKDLPVLLPPIKSISRGGNPLLKEKEWLTTTCPKCGGEATRETDTMDTFVDSSWYFLRFLDPDNRDAPFSVQKAMKGMPVDLYIGGKEHAALHLYYARFFNHFLHSAGLLPHREPFIRLLLQGIVRGKTYQLKSTGEYVPASLVKEDGDKVVHAETGEELIVDWQKMSKSKHNGVEPLDLLDRFGTDTTRLVIVADVGPRGYRDWTEGTFRGIIRWQSRIWEVMRKFYQVRSENRKEPPADLGALDEAFFQTRNYVVDMVNYTMNDTLNLAVAITKMQVLTNSLMKASPEAMAFSPQFERAVAAQIILLAPLAPSFASELWSRFVQAPNRLEHSGEIQWDQGVFQQSWPVTDSTYQSKLHSSPLTIKARYDQVKKIKKKKKAVMEGSEGDQKMEEDCQQSQVP